VSHSDSTAKQNTAQQRQQIIYTKWANRYDWETAALHLILGKKFGQRLFAQIDEGPMLEVGVAAGANLPYYPSHVAAHAVDVTPAMIERARHKATRLDLRVDFQVMDVTELAFPNNFFHRIVASFIFCAVEDQLAAFAEMRRVLHPDGQIRLIEHVLPSGRLISRLFARLDNFWLNHFGCHLTCHTIDHLHAANLQVLVDEPRWGGVFRYLEVRK